MRVKQEVLAAVLRQKGLSDAEITEILATLQVTAKTEQSRSRAKLVKSEKLDDGTLQNFRQELLLREWERRLRSQQRIFQATGVQISPTKSVVVFRHDDTVILTELKHSVGKRTPYNRRFIAQKLKPVKAERIEILRLVVSDKDTVRVLTPITGSRGVRLPESERKWLVANLDGVVTVRCGQWQARLPKPQWQQIVKSWKCKYPMIERKWSELEVSADGEKWFRVEQLIVDKRH